MKVAAFAAVPRRGLPSPAGERAKSSIPNAGPFLLGLLLRAVRGGLADLVDCGCAGRGVEYLAVKTLVCVVLCLALQLAGLPVKLRVSSDRAEDVRCCCCASAQTCRCGCEAPAKDSLPPLHLAACPCDDAPAVLVSGWLIPAAGHDFVFLLDPAGIEPPSRGFFTPAPVHNHSPPPGLACLRTVILLT